ncbi:MAG: RelA/SpoT family protein [Patescibacteria group bacterium UBA2163]
MSQTYFTLKDILSQMREQSSDARDIVTRAWEFAQKAHDGQKRLSGEPYFQSHIASTGYYLAEAGMDASSIAAGLLHDTIEDTQITPEELEKEFNAEIRFIVEGVTKLGTIKYRGMERHVESMRKLLVATAQDLRVIIVKMYDRLHNMQTNKFHEPERQKRKALETMEVYVPIAERLGMGNIKAQLEDLAFATLEPEKYEELTHRIDERKKEVGHRIDEDIKDLKKTLGESGLRDFRTEYRVKGVHSFSNKAHERYNDDLSAVLDLFALRVILKNTEDCYRALGIVHGLWRPIPGKVKDYIAFPKPNGYQSIHTTVITRRGVTVELQLRTELMHRDAQYGVASHFNYKQSPSPHTSKKTTFEWLQNLIPNLRRRTMPTQNGVPTPRWLRDLSYTQEEHPESQTFEDILKKDVFAERIFAFTPKGDVIDLPLAATPIDFAYSIHSDVGDTMNGAKVNGKMASFESTLKNGDVVEILTSKNAKPNHKWLGVVKTAGAKSHIKSALKKEEEENSH